MALGAQDRAAEGLALVFYTIAFLAAGFVTPGLQHMTLGLAPPDARGRFFALKDIVTSCVNSGCTLVLGRLLDWQIDRGHALAGYAMIGLICLALSAMDAGLLAATRENPVAFTSHMRLTDVMIPVRDKNFRPMLLYSVLGGLAGGFATPFLVVYQMREDVHKAEGQLPGVSELPLQVEWRVFTGVPALSGGSVPALQGGSGRREEGDLSSLYEVRHLLE